MLKKEIVKLADKWVSKFFGETTNHIEFVDRYFADDCENLGFVMKHAIPAEQLVMTENSARIAERKEGKCHEKQE